MDVGAALIVLALVFGFAAAWSYRDAAEKDLRGKQFWLHVLKGTTVPIGIMIFNLVAVVGPLVMLILMIAAIPFIPFLIAFQWLRDRFAKRRSTP